MQTRARKRIITSEQIIKARNLLCWTSYYLAKRAGVSTLSVNRVETPEGLLGARSVTLSNIRLAFEAAGIVFSDGDVSVDENSVAYTTNRQPPRGEFLSAKTEERLLNKHSIDQDL